MRFDLCVMRMMNANATKNRKPNKAVLPHIQMQMRTATMTKRSEYKCFNPLIYRAATE